MTTKPDYRTRIEEHKIRPKLNNRKFDIIRQQTDQPWQYGIIRQWQKPFINSNQGLAFMAEYEQYYIKEYQTYNTTYGLNNSPGGDYSSTWPTTNTSGILGVYFHITHNAWGYVDPYDPKRKCICQNKNLPLLLYQMRDQYNIEPIILNEENYKKSLQKSEKFKKTIKRQHYYCGSPNITIKKAPKTFKKEYAWKISSLTDKKSGDTTRANTFDVIKKYGHSIYTKPLFAYMAIGLENEWLLNNYTVDQSKFMPFSEFEEDHTITSNQELKDIILKYKIP